MNMGPILMQNKEMDRVIPFTQAINEALDQMMEVDPSVFLIGEGVPDPLGIFGTCKGLQEKHGKDRVYDMPVSENGMTGVGIGAAIVGMRPVMSHMRVDFTIYAFDQIINNAAKWYSMFGGQRPCPMVIRMIIGQGWGQGNQHSQNLQPLYAHIPGLKVVVPSSAYEAKGLLISSIKDNNPVMFIEHRWLHNTTSYVPEKMYEIPLSKASVVQEGSDMTIVTWGYWLWETLKAVEYAKENGISVEVIDVKTLSPLDFETIKKSVKKTNNLIVVDGAWRHGSMAAEVVTRVCEDEELALKNHPIRVTLPHFPTPSTPAHSKYYYPKALNIFEAIEKQAPKVLDRTGIEGYESKRLHDVPDKNFTGPF